MANFDERNERRDEYPFELPNGKADLSDLQIPKDIVQASDAIKAPIEDLFCHPERYSFEKVQELANYLAGKNNRASIYRMGGALQHDYLFFENPEPVVTVPIAVREVWRFSAYRSAAHTETIMGDSFAPHYLQLEDGATITEEVLKVPLVDAAWDESSKNHIQPLHSWFVRLVPQTSLVLDGGMLRNARVSFKDAERPERAWFPELDFLHLGTGRSLGLITPPGLIRMVDFASKRDETPGEDFKHTFFGLWRERVSGTRDGSKLDIAFERAGGTFSNHSVTISNEGEIPIALKFWPRVGRDTIT